MTAPPAGVSRDEALPVAILRPAVAGAALPEVFVARAMRHRNCFRANAVAVAAAVAALASKVAIAAVVAVAVAAAGMAKPAVPVAMAVLAAAFAADRKSVV